MAKFGYTPLQRDRTMAVMFLRRTHGDAPTTGANQAVTRRTIVKLSLFYSGTMPLVQDPFQPMRQSILDLSRQIPQGTAHNTQGSLLLSRVVSGSREPSCVRRIAGLCSGIYVAVRYPRISDGHSFPFLFFSFLSKTVLSVITLPRGWSLLYRVHTLIRISILPNIFSGVQRNTPNCPDYRNNWFLS